MEDKLGSLEVGNYADLVMLDRNPFDVGSTEISEIDVLMTMMDGRFTYDASSRVHLGWSGEDPLSVSV